MQYISIRAYLVLAKLNTKVYKYKTSVVRDRSMCFFSFTYGNNSQQHPSYNFIGVCNIWHHMTSIK